MIIKNKKEEKIKINNYESIEKFLKNSKDLLKELKPIYNNNEVNKKQSIIFKYLYHIQFGIYILPYLTIKEILFLRATSKKINYLINSNICCINYYFKTIKKNSDFIDNGNFNSSKRKFNSQLKPFHELNDESEFLEQKNILKKIKDYIKAPNFSLDYLLQIYRVEMDYLKYEESHQERFMNSLRETQNKIKEEYQLIKGKPKKTDESWVNINKEEISENYEIKDINLKEMKEEDLKKKIQELKMKKENILFKLNNAKKTNEEINAKNDEKKKIINKLKKLGKIKEIVNDNENESEKGDLAKVNEFLKGN